MPPFGNARRAPKRLRSRHLTRESCSASIRPMAKAHKPSSGSSRRSKGTARSQAKLQKKKGFPPPSPAQRGGVELVDPLVQAQLKTYDEALSLFHQQKFARAKQELEKVVEGPSKELADRARMHVKIAEQRMKPLHDQNPRTADEHYQRGVAMMNVGRWDDARESLDKARRAAPKDEDFALLQEDPRFTELLYPEKDGTAG